MTWDYKASKIAKVAFRKTGTGRRNLLIDAAFHGPGRTRAVLDEVAHSINEGGFKASKFLRYGNAAKIFGRGVSGALKATLRGARLGTKLTTVLRGMFRI